MTPTIPENFHLGKLANDLVREWNMVLEDVPQFRTSTDILQWIDRPTAHMISALTRSATLPTVYLSGRSPTDIVLRYAGGVSKRSTPVELLYTATAQRIVGITFGYPPQKGVLEVYDIPGSLVLERLSGVSPGIGGRGVVIASNEAPMPQPFYGVSQFEFGNRGQLPGILPVLLLGDYSRAP